MKLNENTPLENNKNKTINTYLCTDRKTGQKKLTNYNNKIKLTVTIAPTR